LADDHNAVIERTTGDCTGGDPEAEPPDPDNEHWLRIALVTVTNDALTIKPGSGTSHVLVLRFESSDTTNTLTVDNTIIVDGVNGHVGLTVQDDAILKGANIKFVGGSSGTVTVTAKGGAKILTY